MKNIERPVRIYNVVLDAGLSKKSAPEKPHPEKVQPSIAVLPFDSFAADERWQRIADGIVE
ncbi:hypothetical protein [Sinorhizobium fredii]|uniref:hypothetical protein n=1 Tax=Rhizobium fredii TaxID=380 RepID=UPI000694C06A|nr:hypothetical protein [Sinorhizobium fredii]WOS66711.1 hypothetical protein SFGR64A_23945 [Sinorhizobium fredii GR64]